MAKGHPDKLRFAALATDMALFALREHKLHVLLISVHRPPFFVHAWGLPGGLIHPKETAEQSALRHLYEKAGFEDVYREQLHTFSKVERDPRGRVVSVAYLGLISQTQVLSQENPKVKWVSVVNLPKLAYDHNEIVKVALAWLRAKIDYTDIARYFMPDVFSLTELQGAHEAILGKKLDKRNFRKKIRGLGFVAKTGEKRRGQENRPAELYGFKKLGI